MLCCLQNNFGRLLKTKCRVLVLAWIAIIPCALCLQGKVATAANGDVMTFPLPLARGAKASAFSKQSGLQLKVDSTWAGSRGYRPVRVTATLATAATSDTQITIEFFAGTWRSNNRSITVEHDFELPQGAVSATAQLSVPQHLDWNAAGWNVWVDGIKDESLCNPGVAFNGGSNGAVAVGQLGGGVARFNSGLGSTLVQQATSASVEDLVFSTNGSDLPDSWIDYSALDVFTTTVGSLEMLNGSSPQKLKALLRWVRAGGNLWVLDAGQDFEDLPRLDRVLDPNLQNQGEPDDEAATTSPAWKFAILEGTGRSRLNELINLTMDEPNENRKLSDAQIMDSKFPDTAVDSRQWFVARGYGLGTIVAMQEVEFRRRRNQSPVATALQRSAVVDYLNWSRRHGNDPATGNPNFNNWLIADVGAAPVFEFQMLITLFAIGIGPVNYWLLKRRNQLPVILLTVPLAALATTLILFAYGFLADGIGTRVRARSVTMLDQQAGESATWARLSYYAGIAPSDGLEMPKDTTVYPIQPSRSEYTPFGRRRRQQERSLDWVNTQKLKGGWLGSRTPTQYQTITARPTGKRLEFKSIGEELQVFNALETDVKTLIVQDHEGKFFLGESIEAGKQVELKPCEHGKAASALRLLLTENLPELPPGYVESSGYRRGNDYGNPMSESLMELQIEAINSPTTSGWGNGSYLAVTEEGIELPLGLENAIETSSFHLVRGSW